MWSRTAPYIVANSQFRLISAPVLADMSRLGVFAGQNAYASIGKAVGSGFAD